MATPDDLVDDEYYGVLCEDVYKVFYIFYIYLRNAKNMEILKKLKFLDQIWLLEL